MELDENKFDEKLNCIQFLSHRADGEAKSFSPEKKFRLIPVEVIKKKIYPVLKVATINEVDRRDSRAKSHFKTCFNKKGQNTSFST